MGQQPQPPQPVDTTCGSLLRELQHIWDEVGETDVERDKMLVQLEQECLEVYRRKVDQSNHARARLHQALAEAETELNSLFSALGERPLLARDKRAGSLKEQLEAVGPQLEELRQKKDERARQFVDVKGQIAKICGEIAGSVPGEFYPIGDQDLSLRRLEEYQAQLQSLQKEKSDRLHKVLGYVTSVHELCVVLGMDFYQIVTDVHPSLDDSNGGQFKSISNDTLDRLAKTIRSLQDEKKKRIKKLQELGASMLELWALMDTPLEDQKRFEHVTCNIAATEDEVVTPGALARDIIEQAEVEVERLDQLKVSKMKELVLKKRLDLEEICRNAHMEPDASTAEEKTNAMIDSGMMDASELLNSIEEHILKAKEEAFSRREILEKMEKWMSACEEEGWLEDYNKDDNRYNASKGAHINLKRAERARATIAKLPSLVESLTVRTRQWEEDRNAPFLFDGVRLLAMLDEYNFLRQERDEEKRRMRDQKRLQEQLTNEKETLFGSRPSPIKTGVNIPKKANGGATPARVNGNGTPLNRRLSLGNAPVQPPATPEPARANGVNSSRLGSAAVSKTSKQEKCRPAAPVLNPLEINKEDNAFLQAGNGLDPTSPKST